MSVLQVLCLWFGWVSVTFELMSDYSHLKKKKK